MTNEEKVKRLYPNAHAVYSIRAITIFADDSASVLGERIGYNGQSRQAWSNAWENIRAARRESEAKETQA